MLNLDSVELGGRVVGDVTESDSLDKDAELKLEIQR